MTMKYQGRNTTQGRSDLSETQVFQSYIQFELLIISDKMACSQHYQCLLNDVIIDKSFLCDDFIDCTKGDDERFCDFR